MPEPLHAAMFDPACPDSTMPVQIGGRWTALVVLCLEAGPRRFGELRVPLAGVTPKVLTATLRAMERDGMVTRGMCPEDRRGIYVCVTDAGRARYKAARPAHRAALAESLSA